MIRGILFLLTFTVSCVKSPIPLVRNKHYDELKTHLDKNPQTVNYKTENGTTALHEACYYKSVKTVKLLLAKGANPNAKTAKGNLGITPFHNAVVYNKNNKNEAKEIILLLIKYGADINSVDSNGRNVLLHDVSNGKSQFFSLLMDNGADLFQKGKNGYTAFSCLCELSNMPDYTPGYFFKYLDDNKIKINFNVTKRNEAIITDILIQDKELKMLKLLVKHGHGKDLLRSVMMDNITAAVKILLSMNIPLPQDYSAQRLIKLQARRRRRGRNRQQKRPVIQKWNKPFYCTEAVHEIVKQHVSRKQSKIDNN